MGSVLGGGAPRRPPKSRRRQFAARRLLVAEDRRTRTGRWTGREALRRRGAGDQVAYAAEASRAAQTSRAPCPRCQKVESGRHRKKGPAHIQGLVRAV